MFNLKVKSRTIVIDNSYNGFNEGDLESVKNDDSWKIELDRMTDREFRAAGFALVKDENKLKKNKKLTVLEKDEININNIEDVFFPIFRKNVKKITGFGMDENDEVDSDTIDYIIKYHSEFLRELMAIYINIIRGIDDKKKG